MHKKNTHRKKSIKQAQQNICRIADKSYSVSYLTATFSHIVGIG